MAQIPLITNRQPLASQDFPIAPPAAYGAGTAREVDRSAEVFARIQEGYDVAESAKLIGEGSAGMRGVLIDAKTNITDPDEYATFTKDKLADMYGSTLEKASSAGVRRRVEAQLADNKAAAEIEARYGHFEKKKDRALGDLEIAFDQQSKAAAGADDPNTRASIMRNFGALMGTMKASGFLTDQQLAAKGLAFEKNVLVNRGNGLINRDPVEFLRAADAGEFDRLGEDIWKFRENARKQIEHDEIVRDRATNKLKQGAEQDWYSRLAQDQLTDSEIAEAAKGNHPYITPQKALEFKTKKESGTALIGGDSTGVKAIMEEYYSGPSSFGRINQARASLRALRAGNNSHNPLISKAFNELQSDERTMIGIGVTQTNQAVTAAKESYEANVPATGIPFLDKLRNQNKAKVGEAVRKGQDPSPLIKGKQTEHKARFEQIPEQQKKVIDLAK